MPSAFPNQVYTFDLTEGKGEDKKGILDTEYFTFQLFNYFCHQHNFFFLLSELSHIDFDRIDLLCLGASAAFGVWYLLKKVSVKLVLYLVNLVMLLIHTQTFHCLV